MNSEHACNPTDLSDIGTERTTTDTIAAPVGTRQTPSPQSHPLREWNSLSPASLSPRDTHRFQLLKSAMARRTHRQNDMPHTYQRGRFVAHRQMRHSTYSQRVLDVPDGRRTGEACAATCANSASDSRHRHATTNVPVTTPRARHHGRRHCRWKPDPATTRAVCDLHPADRHTTFGHLRRPLQGSEVSA